MKSYMWTRFASLAVLTAILAAMLAAPAVAQHRDHGRGYAQSPQWHRGGAYWDDRYRDNSGAIVGGVLLGVGIGALLGGVLAAPPPVVYAPPPPPPPPYYPNPYAPPPPVYYGY